MRVNELLKRTGVCLAAGLLIIAGSSKAFAEDSDAALAAALDARNDDLKARDRARNPEETLKLFGVEPGMTVLEVLPGGGWYTKILAPLVGSEGAIYGVNYADDMWAMFGLFSDDFIAGRVASTAAFAGNVAGYPGAADVPARAFTFGAVPDELKGTVDVVVMVRALHNLNRFEARAAMRSQAIDDLYTLVKTGGVVGVVQHRAPADADDSWADGSSGYLKEAAVIAMFQQAGFELAGSSEVNANPNDKPETGDIVWRLPPSLRTSPDQKEAMSAIGESDRMTLKFVKK